MWLEVRNPKTPNGYLCEPFDLVFQTEGNPSIKTRDSPVTSGPAELQKQQARPYIHIVVFCTENILSPKSHEYLPGHLVQQAH